MLRKKVDIVIISKNFIVLNVRVAFRSFILTIFQSTIGRVPTRNAENRFGLAKVEIILLVPN